MHPISGGGIRVGFALRVYVNFIGVPFVSRKAAKKNKGAAFSINLNDAFAHETLIGYAASSLS